MEKNRVPSSRRGPSRGQAFTLVELAVVRKRQGKAFTLIELLVVVAIIGVLAGLLFPTFRGIGQLARSSGCASNLHALQVGLTQFLAANRFRAPGSDWHNIGWVANNPREVWWGDEGRANIAAGQIWDYVQNYETYLCPDFEDVCRRPPPGAQSRPGVPYGQAYTGWWGGTVPGFDPSSFDPVRSYGQSEQIGFHTVHFANLDTSKTVWLCDENPWRQLYQYPGATPPEFGINNAHVGVHDAPGEYHGGKANCTFGDGHVEKLTPVEILENIVGTN